MDKNRFLVNSSRPSLTMMIYLSLQKLAWIEERLGQLMTDDPSVISDSLAQYGDLVYLDKSSVLHK